MAFGAGFKLNNKDNSRSRHSLLPQDPDEPRKSIDADLISPPLDKSHEHHHAPTSWSAILENWYCHPSLLSPAPPVSDVKSQHDQSRASPYELLVKERMMGIYLAVFVHRDARQLVRGMPRAVSVRLYSSSDNVQVHPSRLSLQG